jgi:excisionase family DNA binding protein
MKERKQQMSVGDLVTVYGAARALGLTFWQLDRLIRKGAIPVVRIGNTRLVRLSDVEVAAR